MSTSYIQAVTRNNWEKHGERPTVLDFGAVGDGVTDDGPAINVGIAAMVTKGGGTLWLPSATYAIATPIVFPMGASNITLQGNGPASKLLRTADLGVKGVINIPVNCSFIGLSSFKIDGGVTTPVGLQYGAGTSTTLFNNDPMDTKLSNNSSIRVDANAPQPVTVTIASPGTVNLPNTFIGGEIVTWTNTGGTLPAPFTTGTSYYVVNPTPVTFQLATTSGGAALTITTAGTGSSYITQTSSTGLPINNVLVDELVITHTGGYSILLNTVTDRIQDVTIRNCVFENNRPHLFGTTIGDLNYGAWTGGIHYQGYMGASGINVRNLLVDGCTFRRNTGNCVWGHAYSLASYHENIKVMNNHFEDCGLDGTEMGVVSGGAVSGNTFRRIGYICTDDTSASVPKYLSLYGAVAIDTAGTVTGVTYSDNSVLSVYGGYIDLDGFTNGVVSDNYCRLPLPGDVEYTEDSTASLTANVAYGVNIGNSAAAALNGRNITVSGNTFVNLGAGAIRVFGASNAKVVGNNIQHPATAIYPPIVLANVNSSLRTINCSIVGNTINWSPSGGVAAAILESSAYTSIAWVLGDKNWISNNHLFGTCREFDKDPTSNSVCAVMVSGSASWLYSGLVAQSSWLLSSLAPATSISGTVLAYMDSTSNDYRMSVNGSGFNLRYDGNILSLAGSSDAVPAINVSSGYIAATGGFNSTSTSSAAVNIPNGTVQGKYITALSGYYFTGQSAPISTPGAGTANMYYDSVLGALRYNLGGAGWVTIAGGTPAAAGSNTQIQFNSGGVLAGSPDLTWSGTAAVSPAFVSTSTGGGVGYSNNGGTGTFAGIYGNGQIDGQWLALANQSSPPTASGSNAFIYATASGIFVSCSGVSGGAYQQLGGSATAAGSNAQVQFNNSGVLGASSAFTWNNSSGVLVAPFMTSGAFTSTATGGSVAFSNNGGTGTFAGIYGNGQVTGQWLALANQSSPPALFGPNAFLYTTASGLFLGLSGGGYSQIATQAYVNGLGFITSSSLSPYALNSSLSLYALNSSLSSYVLTSSLNSYAQALNQSLVTTASPTFNVVTGGIFNSTATGSTPAIQQASGTFSISGSGNAAFQQIHSSGGIISTAGIEAPGFNVTGGYDGVSGDVTVGGVHFIFVNGICTYCH